MKILTKQQLDHPELLEDAWSAINEKENSEFIQGNVAQKALMILRRRPDMFCEFLGHRYEFTVTGVTCEIRGYERTHE